MQCHTIVIMHRLVYFVSHVNVILLVNNDLFLSNVGQSTVHDIAPEISTMYTVVRTVSMSWLAPSIDQPNGGDYTES